MPRALMLVASSTSDPERVAAFHEWARRRRVALLMASAGRAWRYVESTRALRQWHGSSAARAVTCARFATALGWWQHSTCSGALRALQRHAQLRLERRLALLRLAPGRVDCPRARVPCRVLGTVV